MALDDRVRLRITDLSRDFLGDLRRRPFARACCVLRKRGSGVMDRLLDAGEVAGMLAVPVGWVREHTRSGLIPHVRLGRYVRYRREAVLGWVVEQDQGGARHGGSTGPGARIQGEPVQATGANPPETG